MRPEIDFYVQQEHYKDLLREAEQDRLVQLALAANKRQNRVYLRNLNWFGQQFINSGCYLQAHFGAIFHDTAECGCQVIV